MDRIINLTDTTSADRKTSETQHNTYSNNRIRAQNKSTEFGSLFRSVYLLFVFVFQQIIAFIGVNERITENCDIIVDKILSLFLQLE